MRGDRLFALGLLLAIALIGFQPSALAKKKKGPTAEEILSSCTLSTVADFSCPPSNPDGSPNPDKALYVVKCRTVTGCNQCMVSDIQCQSLQATDIQLHPGLPPTAPSASPTPTPDPSVAAWNADTAKYGDQQDSLGQAKGYTISGTNPVTSSDQCDISGKLGDNKMCQKAYASVNKGQAVLQSAEIVRSTAVQTLGQVQLAKAQNDGNISAAYKAQGTVAVEGGSALSLAGTLNVAMGAYQQIKAKKALQRGAKVQNALKSVNVQAKSDAKDDGYGSADTSSGKTAGENGYVDGQLKPKDAQTPDAYTQGLAQAAVKELHLNDYGDLYAMRMTDKRLTDVKKRAEKAQGTAAATAAQEAAEKAEALNKDEHAKRNAGIADKEEYINTQIARAGSQSNLEHSRAASAAKSGAMKSLATGLGQMASGAASIAAGIQLLKTAKTLTTPSNPTVTVDLPSMDAPNVNDQVRNAQAITGSGADDSSAVKAADTSADSNAPGPTLGTPVNPKGVANTLPPGPPPGKITKDDSAPPLGGAGGIASGAGTSVAPPETESGPSAAAKVGREPTYYGGGGFAMAGGGKGGNENGPDPDMAALLNAMKNKDDPERATGGSLAVFGNESLDSAPPSLLDKKVNIFERIHTTYVEKTPSLLSQ